MKGRKPQGAKAMSPEQLQAYGRGYYAGVNKRWPEEIGIPPDTVVGPYVQAAQGLASSVSEICGMLDDTDDWVKLMKPKLAALDQAALRINEWIGKPPIEHTLYTEAKAMISQPMSKLARDLLNMAIEAERTGKLPANLDLLQIDHPDA